MLTTALEVRIAEVLGSDVRDARLTAKDELTVAYDLTLADGRVVTLRIPSFGSTGSLVESEVATARYLSCRTTIPIPAVLAFQHLSNDDSTPCFAVFQKPSGTSLDVLFPKLSIHEQDQIVATIARWMLDLFHHRFDRIGSLTDESGSIGPISSKLFYEEGRSKFSLDRGPFTTARAYYLACAQRELDACRMLFAQDAPPSYQRDLEDSRMTVERIAGMLCDLTNRCHGLDDDDPEMAPFSLDIHEIALKDIFVSPGNPTNIVAVTGWQCIATRPLWCCARLPSWLSPSLSVHNQHARLAGIFKAEVARLEGLDSIFLRALDLDDARSTLDDLSNYDAFRDGFLLLPALENILATLPGHEDFAGLNALLDPSTLPGRVARINLLTRGSNALYLAMTPPRSPLMGAVHDDGTEKGMPPDSAVLVT
ncbi:uncharacterized protein TRAVEDRAFT_150122 [Trametes versicolor FP-101664 SS1]|uniref:uncharacterized protein n=1 Tax=Trametes versicolor (strain FP-101664) TaxID=717944 RepID=UPI0004623F68|nr:uncharacterized protein TRAVEDRAFT_150122 [Trametes versicolor FP-101664 SS1]EIW57590.1 hypothetical protein TRAVEDRAFT_150122 [Trametes versicolor FP-101664 SS1]